MQMNKLPSCNLVRTAWIHKQHPDFANGRKLNNKMFNPLDGFDEFQFNIGNTF